MAQISCLTWPEIGPEKEKLQCFLWEPGSASESFAKRGIFGKAQFLDFAVFLFNVTFSDLV